MSVALYVVTEKGLPGFDASSVCGKALETAQNQLDALAKQLGLTPLTDFISVDPEEAADFLEGEGIDDVIIPAEQWYDADDGLKTVQGLLAALREEPGRLKKVKTERVVEDLDAIEKMLLAARKLRVRFHLAVDF
jgi:hypothetical protein